MRDATSRCSTAAPSYVAGSAAEGAARRLPLQRAARPTTKRLRRPDRGRHVALALRIPRTAHSSGRPRAAAGAPPSTGLIRAARRCRACPRTASCAARPAGVVTCSARHAPRTCRACPPRCARYAPCRVRGRGLRRLPEDAAALRCDARAVRLRIPARPGDTGAEIRRRTGGHLPSWPTL
ncbi:MAG: hypothetical protein MZW92_05140 [Comamonadaceae bacterium]|nr:hypothetical protein [Comamonadaceae bacterium]